MTEAKHKQLRNDHFIEKDIVLWLGIVLYICLLLWRSWDNITYPGLYVEDGPHYFGKFYSGERPLSFIFNSPHGYYNILNNLIAWLTAKLDVRVHALSYHVFALIFCTITSISLVFSGLFKTRTIIFIAPLCFGLSAINHIFYYNTLTFQMYVAVILLLCLLFFQPPKSVFIYALLYFILPFLIWSGPYSVVAVPMSLSLMILFPEKKRVYLLLWVVLWCIVYTQFTSKGMVRIDNIFYPKVQMQMLDTIFSDVFLFGFFGDITLNKVLIFLLLLTINFSVLRKNNEYFRYAIVLFVIIISSIAPFFLSEKFLIYSETPKPCNIVIAQFFWIALILYTFDTYIVKIKLRVLNFASVLLVVFFVLFDNRMNVEKRKVDLDLTASKYLETIYHAEQLNLSQNNQFVILKRVSANLIFFPTWVLVGTRRKPDAQQLLRGEIKLPIGNEFVSNVYLYKQI